MSQLPLRDLHQSREAQFLLVNGAEAVQHYTDPSREYSALGTSAALLDLTFRGRLCLLGQDRVKFLHGQVTNDINALPSGGGCYAAVVNSKGKMEADLVAYKLPDELLLDFEPGLSEGLLGRLEKYIIAEDVQLVDVAPHFGLLSLQGPLAEPALQSAGFSSLPASRHKIGKHDHGQFGEVYISNHPRTGSSGYDLFVAVEKLPASFLLLEKAAASVKGTLAGWSALETARIEAGIPRFGADMDNSTLPPEAGLDKTAISYSKGCYIGQEIIARIRTYGQVAKSLHLLKCENSQTPPTPGTKVFLGERSVGHVTSSCWSPRHAAALLLAYLRREVDKQSSDLRLCEPAGTKATILRQV